MTTSYETYLTIVLLSPLRLCLSRGACSLIGATVSILAAQRQMHCCNNLLQSYSAQISLPTTFKLLPNKLQRKISNLSAAYAEGNVCHLEPGGRVLFDILSGIDEIKISMVGQNNGLLIQSPFFCFLNAVDKLSDEEIKNNCHCGFSLRAGFIYENVGMEIIAPIPVDIKTLSVKLVAGKPEYRAIKKDDTEVLVLRGRQVTASSQFAICDNERTVQQFKCPVSQQNTVQSETEMVHWSVQSKTAFWSFLRHTRQSEV